MRLAAVQYKPPHGRPVRARKELVRLANAAIDAGAQLVVLPEMATTGYVFRDGVELRPHAEPVDGPTLAALGPIAARGAWIVCGFAEIGEDGHLYNSALVIRPDGQLATSYRKILLFQLDTTWARPGQQRVIVPTPMGDLAVAICMDINDDRLVTWLAMTRPAILAFCTNWVNESGVEPRHWWRHQLRGWGGWMVAANRWGEERGVRFSGKSSILAPYGRIAAEAEAEGDSVVLVDTADWAREADTASGSTQGHPDRWR